MLQHRLRFPILQSKVFLNSCSKGALARDVRQAYTQYLDDWEQLGSPWELWVHKLEQVRHLFAGLIGANQAEIAVATSVSQAVSSLASAFDFSGQRKKVVVDDFAFPGVAQVWHAQAARGAQVVHVPAAGSSIPLSRYADLIDDRTALVSISHVCYRNGVKQDAAAIADIAHRKGALVLLDAYQSLGAEPVDAKALGVDLLVGGALKYLLGSSGLAWLYVRKGLLENLFPTNSGWFTQADIFAMDIHHHTPSPSARRFEAGTPAVPNVYAGIEGLRIIEEVGIEAIAGQIRLLTDAIKAEAMRRGLRLSTPADPQQHGPLIAIRAHRVELLVKRLEQQGIITSSRDGNLRVSPHFYNTLEDVEQLFSVLDRQRDLLV
jgi:selenocysteine lyase/cysteine desulfurase